MTKTMRLSAAATTAVAVALGLGAPASAQTLEQRVADLEAQLADIHGDGTKGFKIAPNTRLRFYGYAKADFIQDFDYSLGDTFGGLGSIVPGAETGTEFTAHARQTRLGFETFTETDLGVLNTKVEGDFFGASGFRLRHAYGQLNGFLVGQTWTNFMPIEMYPDTLDFQGPTGILFARLTQARYTYDFGNGFSLTGAIEEDASDSVAGVGSDERPAVTAAARYGFDGGHVRLAAISRELTGATGTVDGWGVNLSGAVTPWDGGQIVAQVTTGEGIGSYFNYGGTDVIGDEAVESMGYTVGIKQALGEKFDVGLVYGYRDIDVGAAATDTENLTTVHASLFWKPTAKVRTGLEYIYGERELFDGTSADASRLQASVQFNF